MNSNQQASRVIESDAIFKRLDEIRHRIDGPSLSDYLPQQRTNPHRLPQQTSESYRRSLEKKLEKMFRFERKEFRENQSHSFINMSNRKESLSSRNVFTVDRMENKIKELVTIFEIKERKYINSFQTRTQGILPPNQAPGHPQQPGHPRSQLLEQPQALRNSHLSSQDSQRLFEQLKCLKREVKQIKRNNSQISRKIDVSRQKKSNRAKSAKMLMEILERLTNIQKLISKETIRDRVGSSENQNERLTAMIDDLNHQLHQQMAQKQGEKQKNSWIGEQLRRISRI